jgi:4-hydroxybenzoyl-CoA reductase subunit beta
MTELLPDFKLLQPGSIDEAIAMHAETDGPQEAVRYVAGGTDLLVNLRRGIGDPETLISLNRVADMTAIAENDDGSMTIGAGVILAALIEHDTIAKRYPAVAHAAHEIAGPGHRESGTVGGNLCLDTRCVFYNQSLWWRQSNDYCLKYKGDICHVAPKGDFCHAAFSGDLAPVFLVLGAEIEIIGPDGTRREPLAKLYTGDGMDHLTLKPGELLTAIHLPAAPLPALYEKHRVRGAIDFPLAGIAVALTKKGGKIETLKIAVTGTNTSPFLVEDLNGFVGSSLGDGDQTRLAEIVQKQVSPMKTTLVQPYGRRRIAGAMARRLAVRLLEDG